MNIQTPYQLPFGNQPTDVANNTNAPGPQIDVGQQQPQQQAQPQESWWKKLLPVAGAVGGGILGEVVDPFGGGIAGAALGSSLFGGAGQAAGKAVENIASGQSVGKDVLSNALQGAAFGGIGGGIGAGLEKIGGSTAEKATADALRNSDAQTQAATKLANINETKASKLNFSGISPNTQKTWKLGDSQNFVKEMGGNSYNPYEMQKMSNAGLDINNIYKNEILANKTADMSKFGNDTFKNLQSSGVNDLTNSPLGQALSEAGLDIGKPLPKNMPLNQVRELQQAVGKQLGIQERTINNAELNGTTNIDAINNKTSLEKTYKDLEQKIQNPEVNQAVNNYKLTDEQQAAMKADQPITLQDGNKFGGYGETHGQYLIDAINNGKTAKDWTGVMQTHTLMDKNSKAAIEDITQATATPRAEARSLASQEGNPGVALPDKAPEENLLQHAFDALKTITSGGGKINKAMQLAGIAQKTGVGNKIMQGTGSLLSRIGNVAGPTALGAGALGSTLSSGPAGAAQQPMQQGANMQQQANPLQNILAQATNNYMLDPLDFGSSSQGLIGAILPQLQKQALAQSQMNALQQQFTGAGGAQGFGGNGILNQLASALPWTQQAAALKQAGNLGQTLGVNPQLSFLQNPQTSGIQLSALQNAIQGLGGVNPGMSMPVGQ